MNFALITNVVRTVSVTAAKVGFQVSKHSPEILVGAGIAGGAATTVMACKATLKVNEVVMENAAMYEKIESVLESDEVSEEQYSEEDAKKDRTILAANWVKTLICSYGPVALLGAASATSILCGYNILNRRNMALVAAYTTLQSGFSTYRRRVVENYGEETDMRLMTGAVEKKIDTEVEDENGVVKKKKVKTPVIEESTESISYMINFGREAIHIRDRDNITESLRYIQSVEDSMNTVLTAEGIVTLNDVRKTLGCERTSYGQIVGWTQDGTGDDFIHLQTDIVWDEIRGMFTVMIDPNVEGVIINKLDRR